MSDFIASLDAPLGIPKPNTLALVSFDLPIAKGDKIHCLDVLHSLTKYTLGFVDDETEDFSKVMRLNTVALSQSHEYRNTHACRFFSVGTANGRKIQKAIPHKKGVGNCIFNQRMEEIGQCCPNSSEVLQTS
jgi:hypothetical protein